MLQSSAFSLPSSRTLQDVAVELNWYLVTHLLHPDLGLHPSTTLRCGFVSDEGNRLTRRNTQLDDGIGLVSCLFRRHDGACCIWYVSQNHTILILLLIAHQYLAQHLLSGPRLPFTAAYLGSIVLTLYFSVGVRVLLPCHDLTHIGPVPVQIDSRSGVGILVGPIRLVIVRCLSLRLAFSTESEANSCVRVMHIF